MSAAVRALVAGFALLLSACQISHRLQMPALAHAEVASDFSTYPIHRVGVLPVTGLDDDPALAASLREAFQAEFGMAAPYELVALQARDLEAVEPSEPFRRGNYHPRTILALARRYDLDALLFPTVTQRRFYPPQELGLHVDLVAAETGLAIWSAAVHLDANDPDVVTGLKVYYGIGDEDAPHPWELALLSPERFARFGAFQLASLL